MRGGRPAFYSEFDPGAAEWLRELMRAGLIPDGVVDERDIRDIVAADLSGFGSCHFFAGIGGWAYALRLAGWNDSRPVWTGSCPCQPFSSAGKRQGTADARHLWPEFYRLIAECRPPVVFGEQVAGRDGLLWLAGVRADLEAAGYAVGAADLCAAGQGAPHIRQRLYWVADSGNPERGPDHAGGRVEADGRCGRREASGDAGERGPDGRLADADGRQPRDRGLQPGRQHRQQPDDDGAVGDTSGDGRQGHVPPRAAAGTTVRASFWDAYDVIPCRDGKSRRVEPGTFPLADGIPGRVGLLRGYGNAIVPQVAAAFVRSYLDVTENTP